MSDVFLPTATFGSWNVTKFRDSLVAGLNQDSTGTTLQLFFYAVTPSGWYELKEPVKLWQAANQQRKVTMYVGTDHGLTDPTALDLMRKDGVDVRLMISYSGIFHPKVAWLSSPCSHHIWVGSNNLTKNGLVNNVEFGVMVSSVDAPPALMEWAQQVHTGSTPITDELIKSYRSEKKKIEKSRAAAKAATFVWSRRTEPEGNALPQPQLGDLILEVMPEETRGGNQIQLPTKAAEQFLGLKSKGQKLSIELKQAGPGPFRELVVGVYKNNTVRLSINELEYDDRPCMIVLRKLQSTKPGATQLEFEIVSQSVFPTRYRDLLAACIKQTRSGSRHWAIVREQA